MFTHARIMLSSPVLNLTSADDSIIYALTMTNSVSVLKFSDEDQAKATLILAYSDAVRRASVAQYCLSVDFALISDKGMNFVGLQKSSSTSTKLHKAFMIKLDSIVSRIGPGEFKPIWAEEDEVENEDYDADVAMRDGEQGIIEQQQPPKTRVLATGFGGAVYAFKMLNSRESIDIRNRLRKLVETDQHFDLSDEHNRPIYPGVLWKQDPNRHSSNVIDGDYILAKYNEVPWVRDLLSSTSLSTAS